MFNAKEARAVYETRQLEKKAQIQAEALNILSEIEKEIRCVCANTNEIEYPVNRTYHEILNRALVADGYSVDYNRDSSGKEEYDSIRIKW